MISRPPSGVDPAPPPQASTSIYLPKWSLVSCTRGHPVRKTKKNKVLVQIPAYYPYPSKPTNLRPRPSAPIFTLKLDIKPPDPKPNPNPNSNPNHNNLGIESQPSLLVQNGSKQSKPISVSQNEVNRVGDVGGGGGDKHSSEPKLGPKEVEEEVNISGIRTDCVTLKDAKETNKAEDVKGKTDQGLDGHTKAAAKDEEEVANKPKIQAEEITLNFLNQRKAEETFCFLKMPEKPVANQDEFVLDMCNPIHASVFSPVVNLHLQHRRCMHLHHVHLADNRYTPKARVHGALGLCDVCSSVEDVPVEATIGAKFHALRRVVAVEVVEWGCIGARNIRGYVVMAEVDSSKVDIEYLRSMDNETIGYALRNLFSRRKNGFWPRRVIYCKSSRLYCEYFHRWFHQYSVKKTKIPPRSGSKLNPRLEAHILCTHRMVKCAMKDMKVPEECWPWALGWALHQKENAHFLHMPCNSYTVHIANYYHSYYADELGLRVFGSVVYKFRQVGQQLVFPKDSVLGIFIGANNDGLVVYNPDAEPGKRVRKKVNGVWANEALTWEDYKANKEAYTPQRIFRPGLQQLQRLPHVQ